MRAFICYFFHWSAAFILLGCADQSRALRETMSVVWSSNKFKDGTLAAELNPSYRYLRVHNSRGAGLMVLGYIDTDPQSNQSIEVWYSGDNEVVKMQNGRVIATSGLSSDWLFASYLNVPDWTHVVANRAQVINAYSRSIDLKRDYQFGLKQSLTLTQISRPAGHALQGVSGQGVVWFEEKAMPSQLPSSIYAVAPSWNQSGQAKVIYTWHCFKLDECFGFQDWTAKDHMMARSANVPVTAKP